MIKQHPLRILLFVSVGLIVFIIHLHRMRTLADSEFTLPVSATFVMWHPDGTTLAAVESSQISVWPTDNATQANKSATVNLPLESDSPVSSASWSPDGIKIAIGLLDGTLRVWQVTDSQVLISSHEHTSFIRSISWSPSGNTLASSSHHETIIWNVATGEKLLTLPDMVWLNWTPDNQFWITGNQEGLTQIWDARAHEVLAELNEARGFFAEISPDSTKLAGLLFETPTVWSIPSGEITATFAENTHDAFVRAMSWSPDSNQLATGSGRFGDEDPLPDNTIRIWNMDTGQLEMILEGHQDTVVALQWLTEDTTIISASLDDTIRVWNTSNGDLRKTLQVTDVTNASQVAVSPNGKSIAIINKHNVQIWTL